MIKTKEDLKEYINADNSWYQKGSLKSRIIDRISSDNRMKFSDIEYIGESVKIARKYFRNIGIEIYPNCFGKGLEIWHAGGIVVNHEVRVGENCILHGGNCIGNKGSINVTPVLGDNVDIGYGASIIGDVYIADNTIIGTNAVVVKSVNEPGKTVVGVPAHEI